MQATCTALNDDGSFDPPSRTIITPFCVNESPTFNKDDERLTLKFTLVEGVEEDLLHAAKHPVQIAASVMPRFEINSLRSIDLNFN